VKKYLLTTALLISANIGQAADITSIGTDAQGRAFFKVSGEFVAGDIEKFLAATDLSDNALILFHSDGGDLQTGLDIGSQIRMRGYSTAVLDEQYCYSACALAWLGGTKRTIGYAAHVSFHAAYVVEDGDAKESGVGNALVGAYIGKLGLKEDAVVFLTSAPPDYFNELNPSLAKDLGIDVQFSSTQDLIGSLQISESSERQSSSNEKTWQALNADQIASIMDAANNGKVKAQWNAGFLYMSGKNPLVEKDMEKAVYWLSKAAEQGHVNAQLNLYVLYRDGKAVTQDNEIAKKWLLAAKESGSDDAETQLAVNYLFGGVLEKDELKAIPILERLAKKGNSWAQYNLGIALQNGSGINVDEKAAADLFKKSAESGNAAAQFRLALCYLNARGVPIDYIEAARWMQKSADANNSAAQYFLSNMYLKGQGVPKDDILSAKWMSAAAINGDAFANYWVAVNFSSGSGVEHDDYNAASYILKFLRSKDLRVGANNLTANEFANNNPGDWTPGTIAAFQGLLADKGYYKKAVDGSWGPSTVAAVNAFYQAEAK
jgi:TPR repeat protein